ncbi:GNAT family N-acetyltransferase [Planococcus halotolerans]|uniref:GNAT family N-acetyltransferase n=1 Tax=Planococcus halotolerans TaxID=2233542 RepID=A0A365L886_9BACL|nr:GNAT family N-acetyltransferase [Planococcus halotolerans]RAZ81331.1 GNAT family N-acetyltransferase [Planococcus halotolerans]
MKIRKATLADAKGIAHVHVDSWIATYRNIVTDTYLDQLSYEAREQLWKENLKANNNFLAENDNGEIIGFADGGKERTGKYAALQGELYSIYILPEYQGKGIDRSLMKRVIEHLKESGRYSLLVWVLEENPSRAFYEKMDGKEVDRKTLSISGKKLTEIAYGWEDINLMKN